MFHIQILLYKPERFLERLLMGLSSIETQEGIFVHFLENSPENSKESLKKKSKLINFEYTYDKEGQNLGFAKGHNFLFKKFNQDYSERFMMLNHDTLPFYNFLIQIEKFKKYINRDWGIIECNQFPKPHPKDYNGETFETEWASAAATIYRTKVFKEMGGFDEAFFMYCEDVDFSWRIREKGYKIYFCSIAKIGHLTRELDEDKDPSFEEIHSKAGNLFLRYKYFGKKEVQNYLALIKTHSKYKQIIKQYDQMLSHVDKNKIKKYRKYSIPKLYPDTNYAFHRW